MNPDLDEILSDDDDLTVEAPAKTASPIPASVAIGAGIGGIAGFLFAQSRRVHWRYWAGGSVMLAILILYLAQMKPPAPKSTVRNAVDSRSLQVFTEAGEIAKAMGEIDTEQDLLGDALDQERQRGTIRLAMAFRSIATYYMSQPGHLCANKLEIECLESFNINRVEKLEQISDGRAFGTGKTADPRQMIDPIIWTTSEVERVAALRLAMILAKPNETRRVWEQAWLDRQFPILNASLPVEELAPRPGVLARQIRRVSDMQAKLLQGSQESFYKVEREQARQQAQSKN